MAEPTAPNQPLAGLRVLDLSRVLAGPFVGRILADLGAEVVKLEPPEGDLTRTFGRKVAGISGYFTQQNAGKRNVCVDLSSPGGPELVADLASAADLVVENFRPGVLARFGLDYAALSARNPRLIMLSISGFGQDGPESQRAAYASVLHAESGTIARQAAFTGQPPADPAQGFADTYSGLHGLVGLLAALYHRERTGEGQHIDIAMADAMTFTDDYAYAPLDGDEPEPIGGFIWSTPTGPILIAGGDLKLIWRKLTTVHGVAEPTPAGPSLEEKIAARRQAAEAWFASFTDRDALHAALDEANLAWGDVKPVAEVFESPTLAARRSVVDVDDRAGGTRRVMRAPQRFSTLATEVAGPAPHRGEHNTEVLADWLGRDVDEVPPGVLLSGD
jgi:crotonobetainyl-CoA:carnitine CoA-transferase CaiB-like acyl-CoA transferase